MLHLDYFRRTFDKYYTGWDFTFLPFIIIIIIIYASIIKAKKSKEEPIYKYYTMALLTKVFGGILFCLTYTVLYRGGDTTLYFYSGKAMSNLAAFDFKAFWQLLIGNVNAETLSAFNNETGFVYYTRDPKAFAVVRYTSIFVILGRNSYLLSTIVINLFCFSAFWRFYLLLTSIYPHLKKSLFYGIFMIPSVILWGSGILKDTYTMAATLWLTYSFYYIVLKFDRKKLPRNIVFGILSIFILMSIKPYILFALAAGLSVWFVFGYIKKVKSKFLRIFIFPIILVVGLAGGSAGIMQLTKSAGGFYGSPEAMMERAAIVQNDLKQDYYGGNSFDIGGFDPSYTGMLSKAPAAIVAGLFRPFIWEANGPMMLISAMENIFMFLLLVFAVFGRGLKNFGKQLGKNHYVIFSLTFAILLSFMVGITTANFGALVRYKIPFMPFIVTALLIVFFNYRKMAEDKKMGIEEEETIK